MPPRAARPRPAWLLAGVSALAASFLTAGLIAAAGLMNVRSTSHTAVVERQLVQPRPAATGGAGGQQVTDIADQVGPAIVQLQVDIPSGKTTGSGVIFRSDGHLLTNHHVVEGALRIQVVLSSGRQLPGRIVGTDEETDSAVVKINGGPFPVATMGSAADLKVGQMAITIGSPVGLGGSPSVSVGVVSGLHRQVRSRNDGPTLVDMVQTDSPITPGSSGGALLDDRGAVIGIATAAAAEAGSGVGFATPIDLARSVAEQLIATGTVVHVWMGIEGSDLDGTTASELSLDGGAMVAQVSLGSPAHRAGLAASDVIVSVDGKSVRSMTELVVALRGRAPGDSVTLDVVRSGQHRTMSVVLAPRPR